MEAIIKTSPRPLRSLVDKWLAPTATALIYVTRFHPARSQNRRYVRIETTRHNNIMSMFFFRHDDGWCVFPPTTSPLCLNSRVHVSSR
ncbi:hypothetical protein SAMN05446935_7411 [Burkholderia sp. YR290]|nr:hypothetical protein SAMN05446935_7411 [Burkholderia sp. YR290]